MQKPKLSPDRAQFVLFRDVFTTVALCCLPLESRIYILSRFTGKLNLLSQVDIGRLRPGEKQMFTAYVHNIAAFDRVDLIALEVV